MKYLVCIIIFLWLSSCFGGTDTTIAKFKLKDGSIIRLTYLKDVPLGATTPNCIFVNHDLKGKRNLTIDQLRMGVDHDDKIDLYQLNDSVIMFRFSGTKWNGWHREFTINLNRRFENW